MAKAEQCPITGKFFTAVIGDDGTMDTVVCCSSCGMEKRYTFEPSTDEIEEAETKADPEDWMNARRHEWAQDVFVQDHIEDTKEEQE